MEEKFQKIYVGTNEGIASVVDCLINSIEKDIFLIIPPENKNFQNLVTLKLLKREAKTLGKNLIIISSNPAFRKLVSQVGLRAIDYFQIEEVQPEIFREKAAEGEKISDITPLKLPRFPSPPETKLGEEELEEKKIKFLEKFLPKKELSREKEPVEEELLEEPVRKIKPLFSFSKFLILLISICLGIIGFAFYYLPKAKIEITPKTEMISFDLTLKLDKDISEVNFAQRKIPVQLLQIDKEERDELLATGKKYKESKARGTITVYNNYSTASQTLVATTRFISEGGKLFRTTSNITVPGARMSGGRLIPSSIDVEVIAAEFGEDYNIGPSTFSIPGFAGTPKYAGFYGKSNASMSGGFKGEVKFVSNEDLEKARKTLEQRLLGLDAQLLAKIPQNLKLVEGARELRFEDVSQVKTGEERERFEFVLKGICRALVFDEKDIQKLISQTLALKEVNEKKFLPGAQKVNYSLKSIDFKNGKADLSVKVEEEIAWKVDIEKIQNSLVSKSIPEAKEYLASLVSIENARVTLWPFWIKKFPARPEKIKVKIVL